MTVSGRLISSVSQLRFIIMASQNTKQKSGLSSRLLFLLFVQSVAASMPRECLIEKAHSFSNTSWKCQKVKKLLLGTKNLDYKWTLGNSLMEFPSSNLSQKTLFNYLVLQWTWDRKKLGTMQLHKAVQSKKKLQICKKKNKKWLNVSI